MADRTPRRPLLGVKRTSKASQYPLLTQSGYSSSWQMKLGNLCAAVTSNGCATARPPRPSQGGSSCYSSDLPVCSLRYCLRPRLSWRRARLGTRLVTALSKQLGGELTRLPTPIG